MTTDFVHHLVERYGLVAIFIGCMAEGESSAILGGFFAHQHVFVLWQSLAAIFAGAVSGDTLLFMAGKHFAGSGLVRWLRGRPGFDRAFVLVRRHPAAFVVLNSYAYGLRLAGGVAAGLAGIATPKFLLLNCLSAAVWASLFSTVGYVFGLAAESVVGAALARHQRLFIGLGAGLALAALGWWFSRYVARRIAVR